MFYPDVILSVTKELLYLADIVYVGSCVTALLPSVSVHVDALRRSLTAHCILQWHHWIWTKQDETLLLLWMGSVYALRPDTSLSSALILYHWQFKNCCNYGSFDTCDLQRVRSETRNETASITFLRYYYWLLSLVCLGFPVLIVGISAGFTRFDGYGEERLCWLSTQDGLSWAFVCTSNMRSFGECRFSHHH